jgi:hypothetical protein
LRNAGNRLGCGELPTEQLVYAGITEEMIDYTVASVREFVADRQRARCGGSVVTAPT